MSYIPLNIDISSALPDEITQGTTITIGVWLFVPDNLCLHSGKPVVISLLNGGSYDKRYFHAVIPGHSGYSNAEHLCDPHRALEKPLLPNQHQHE